MVCPSAVCLSVTATACTVQREESQSRKQDVQIHEQSHLEKEVEPALEDQRSRTLRRCWQGSPGLGRPQKGEHRSNSGRASWRRSSSARLVLPIQNSTDGVHHHDIVDITNTTNSTKRQSAHDLRGGVSPPLASVCWCYAWHTTRHALLLQTE